MIGFRVSRPKRRVSVDTVAKFKALPTANVSDCMSRLSAFGAALRPLHGGGTVLAGPAMTVRTRPGDNLMIHKAIDIAEPGDVVVVDAGGDLTNALIGELMIAHARQRDLAGFVINGSVRDSDWIARHDFPVFAAGVTNRGPYKDGPGEVGRSISIDGTVIEAGDLVLGDADGLVAVGFEETDTVFAAASAKQAAETAQMEAILAGKNKRAWVDEALNRLGCAVD